VEETSFGIIPLRRHEGEWEVFLIRHLAGAHWGFPKGRGMPGETPLQSAERELAEETSLHIERYLRNIPFTDHYQMQKGGKSIAKTVYYFPAQVVGVPQLQHAEVTEGKWVSLDGVDASLTFKPLFWPAFKEWIKYDPIV
jgi:bis(5'-nucleosidyl)-tetraphosphatase